MTTPLSDKICRQDGNWENFDCQTCAFEFGTFDDKKEYPNYFKEKDVSSSINSFLKDLKDFFNSGFNYSQDVINKEINKLSKEYFGTLITDNQELKVGEE